MNPKYSVIVPVYNAEATLLRCVNSILAQTYPNFELILIDDGSTDTSSDIIDHYAALDSRIQAIHKSNGGVSSARNAGLAISSGEWVIFADSDDEILSGWIQSFDDFTNHYDMVIQELYYSIKSKTWRKEIPIKTYVGKEGIRVFVTEMMKLGLYGYTFTKCFKKSILDKWHIEFDTTCHFREDELFVSQYLTHCNILKTTDSANYIYYLPEADKVYRGDASRGLILVFKALDYLFEGEYNVAIAETHLTNIKNHIVSIISSNQIPLEYDVDLYNRLVRNAGKRSLKDQSIDILILTSSKSSVSRFIIKSIHKLARKWEN